MATTASNFLKFAAGIFRGTGIASATAVTAAAVGPFEAAEVEQGSGGVVIDKLILDPSLAAVPTTGSGAKIPLSGKVLGAYAKNGVVLITLSGTTPVTLDLTDTTSGTTATAGDTAFASVNTILFRSLGAAAVTIAPGGSNPADLPKFTGTTPTLKLALNGVVLVNEVAAVTVDSTHKGILLTPTAGGTIAIYIGGA
jgi:hypothetical protein